MSSFRSNKNLNILYIVSIASIISIVYRKNIIAFTNRVINTWYNNKTVFFTGNHDKNQQGLEPVNCPGINSRNAGIDSACDGCPNQQLCIDMKDSKESGEAERIGKKLSNVKNIILIISGKGGVGKSTIATQLAFELSNKNYRTGLLDIDICGPSIPRMTQTISHSIYEYADGWKPVNVNKNLNVMSIGYLLPNNDDAIIWRGPKKNGIIKQFLLNVDWDNLDYLIIDTPPGTSDEHLSVVSYLKHSNCRGAILVTTSQEVALNDVRKQIQFCNLANLPIIGVVENQSNSVFTEINPNGVTNMCINFNLKYLVKIALDRSICEACDKGVPIIRKSNAHKSFIELANKIILPV